MQNILTINNFIYYSHLNNIRGQRATFQLVQLNAPFNQSPIASYKHTYYLT